MGPLVLSILAISFVVAFFLFHALTNFEMHWGLRLVFAGLPIVATLFAGILGLMISAIVTGAVYKAS